MRTKNSGKSVDERFALNCSPPNANGCINWLGGKDKDGFGRIKPENKKRMRAHRFSYEKFIGTIPKDYCVCHRCDNPSCVNPEHLFLGTNKDNMRDRDIKGRTAKNNLAGYPMRLLPNSKLTKENVLQIRELIASGETQKNIAKQFNVHFSTIQKIKSGVVWYHV